MGVGLTSAAVTTDSDRTTTKPKPAATETGRSRTPPRQKAANLLRGATRALSPPDKASASGIPRWRMLSLATADFKGRFSWRGCCLKTATAQEGFPGPCCLLPEPSAGLASRSPARRSHGNQHSSGAARIQSLRPSNVQLVFCWTRNDESVSFPPGWPTFRSSVDRVIELRRWLTKLSVLIND